MPIPKEELDKYKSDLKGFFAEIGAKTVHVGIYRNARIEFKSDTYAGGECENDSDAMTDGDDEDVEEVYFENGTANPDSGWCMMSVEEKDIDSIPEEADLKPVLVDQGYDFGNIVVKARVCATKENCAHAGLDYDKHDEGYVLLRLDITGRDISWMDSDEDVEKIKEFAKKVLKLGKEKYNIAASGTYRNPFIDSVLKDGPA
jgi:hypothetical protein